MGGESTPVCLSLDINEGLCPCCFSLAGCVLFAIAGLGVSPCLLDIRGKVTIVRKY